MSARSCVHAVLGSVALLCACVAAAPITTASAQQSFLALTGDRVLQRIEGDGDSACCGRLVAGVSSRLLGIDFRSSDGELYGVYQNGVVAVIDHISGIATPVSNAGSFASDHYSVDFDPVTDMLRVIANSTGRNIRIDVATGQVFEDVPVPRNTPNPFGDISIFVRAAAHSNSGAGAAPTTTVLHEIDISSDAIFLNLPPGSGTLIPAGLIGRAVGELGFDIVVDSEGRNRGWIIADQSLFEVDLTGTGIVLNVSTPHLLRTPARDLAIFNWN